MSFMRHVLANFRDARTFGPQFLLRHIRALSGAQLIPVDVQGLGRLHIRRSDSDLAALRQVFRRSEYDLSKFEQTKRLRRKYEDLLSENATPVIIDAGANIGLASVYFAKAFPKARIVAIEPDPANAEVCRMNTAALGNVVVLERALGSKPGSVVLDNPEGLSWSIRTERHENPTHGIEICTIEQAVSAAGPNSKLLMTKIDIEGFEADLFAENIDWIEEAAALIVEPHDWMLPGAFSSGPLQSALIGKQFEILISGENLIFIR